MDFVIVSIDGGFTLVSDNNDYVNFFNIKRLKSATRLRLQLFIPTIYEYLNLWITHVVALMKNSITTILG